MSACGAEQFAPRAIFDASIVTRGARSSFEHERSLRALAHAAAGARVAGSAHGDECRMRLTRESW